MLLFYLICVVFNSAVCYRLLHISDIHLDLLYDSESNPDTYQCKKKVINTNNKITFDKNVILNNQITK